MNFTTQIVQEQMNLTMIAITDCKQWCVGQHFIFGHQELILVFLSLISLLIYSAIHYTYKNEQKFYDEIKINKIKEGLIFFTLLMNIAYFIALIIKVI